MLIPKIIRASTRGRVVIPAELRRELGIKSGARFSVRSVDGRIVMTPLSDEQAR